MSYRQYTSLWTQCVQGSDPEDVKRLETLACQLNLPQPVLCNGLCGRIIEHATPGWCPSCQENCTKKKHRPAQAVIFQDPRNVGFTFK